MGASGLPNPQAGYYDWVLWKVDTTLSSACDGIFNGSLTPVSRNWNCTSGGGTGMGNIPAGATACNFQPSIPVTVGQEFILLFSNYSGINGNIPFVNSGSAQINTCGSNVFFTT